MFNLDSAISGWRKQMFAAGLPSHVLDELADHLRREISSLTRSGMDAAEAIRVAQAQLGTPDSLRSEFKKNNHHRGPINFLAGVCIALLLVFAVFVAPKSAPGKNAGVLLAAHIVTLTAGYVAVLVSGSFGVAHVAFQLRQRLTPSRDDALIHGIKLFNALAAITVLLGAALGMIWSARNPVTNVPPYPGIIAMLIIQKLREYGSFAMCAWLTGSLILQKTRPGRARALVPLGIAGNILVGLAWFGPFLFWSDLPRYYGFNTFWPVEAVIALHLVFLVLALVRKPAPQLKPEN